MKKRSFGVGKYNGVGGKKEDDETIEQAAIREAREEIGVEIKDLSQVAKLNFVFPEKPEWSQQVIVYLVKAWDGEPQESEEMTPMWFSIDEIPYDKMWADDIHWLPLVLENKIIEAQFVFGNNEQLLNHKISIL